jgi:hypothetical protein
MLKKRILLENNNFDKNEFNKLRNLNKNLYNENFKKNCSKEKNDEIFISKISNNNNKHFNTTFRKHINIAKEIDVSELSPGTYSMNIYTKTQDAEDYGELNYLFGVIKSQSTRINNKTYTTSINNSRNNRIELIVE